MQTVLVTIEIDLRGLLMHAVYLKLTQTPRWILKSSDHSSKTTVANVSAATQAIVLIQQNEAYERLINQWIDSVLVKSKVFSHCQIPHVFISFGLQTVKHHLPNLTVGQLPKLIWTQNYPLIILPAFDAIIRNAYLKEGLWKQIVLFSRSIK